MQRFLKVKKLREQIIDAEQRVTDIKSQYHKLADAVKLKSKIVFSTHDSIFSFLDFLEILFVMIFSDIKKQQLKTHLDQLNAKSAIFKVKNIEAANQFHKEKEVLKCIKDAMPVRIEYNNPTDVEACNAIKEVISVLETYYASSNNSTYEGKSERHFADKTHMVITKRWNWAF